MLNITFSSYEYQNISIYTSGNLITNIKNGFNKRMEWSLKNGRNIIK